MNKKNSWIPVLAALVGPFLGFFLLIVASVQVAKRTPEDQLPGALTPAQARPNYVISVAVTLREPTGTFAQRTIVHLQRVETFEGNTETEVYATETDSSGIATFSIPKRGTMTIAVPSWGTMDAPFTHEVRSLENHPDEILQVLLTRPATTQ